jgi:hypothetical protein
MCDLKIDLIGSERIGLQARYCHAGNPDLGFMNYLSVSPTLRHSRQSPAPNFSYLFHKGLLIHMTHAATAMQSLWKINGGETYRRGGARLGEK